VAQALEENDTATEVNADRRSSQRRQKDRDEQQRAVASAWLSWQCKMVAGVLSGAVFSIDGERLESVLAQWPESATKKLSALSILAKHALETGEVIIRPMPKSAGKQQQAQDHIAIPVTNDGGSFIVVMHILARSQSQQQAVVQLVQWGGMWLGSLEQVVSDFSGAASSVSIQLAEQVASHQDLYTACLDAANQLSIDLHCDRVSIGLLQGSSIRLQAISQVTDFDKKLSLVRTIESAMEEAADQKTVINTSKLADNNLVLTRAHDELAASQGPSARCTVPLYCNNQTVGVVMLERDEKSDFSVESVNHVVNVLAPLGPVLQLIQRDQRNYFSRIRHSVTSRLNRQLIPDTRNGRLAAAACLLAALFALLVPVPYKVSAEATIEGSDKQVLVAPQAGYIKSANARAGDSVTKGQVIASLENRELLIERDMWLGELGKIDTSLAGALSTRDRSELGMLQAKKAQVDAELALLDEKLSRANLVAPFDGVLVSGDLNQALGSPVDVGQILFEIASMEEYRLVLEIDEHDVAGVEPGQPGVLRFSALPGNKHKLETSAVVPVAVTRNRKSVFLVEAQLAEMSDKLRPGMRGVAKVHVGEKPLIWIWTHGLISKLRLWFWKTGLS